ncbi:MAG: hypothetical protein JOZ19_04510 [Rubrobacter sp.]|nr:hypothetical protein [Rubrobacter sp.]
MGSLAARISQLEERRSHAAIQLIFECARAASLDDVARFITASFELEQEGMAHEDDEREARAWAYLGIPLEAVRVAEPHPELWCSELGDMLADKRGLREHLCEHHPESADALYGQRGAAS